MLLHILSLRMKNLVYMNLFFGSGFNFVYHFNICYIAIFFNFCISWRHSFAHLSLTYHTAADLWGDWKADEYRMRKGGEREHIWLGGHREFQFATSIGRERQAELQSEPLPGNRSIMNGLLYYAVWGRDEGESGSLRWDTRFSCSFRGGRKRALPSANDLMRNNSRRDINTAE